LINYNCVNLIFLRKILMVPDVYEQKEPLIKHKNKKKLAEMWRCFL
jgi:hypothetical protein